MTLIKFVQTPNPTKPWRGPRLHRRDAQRVEAGERWEIEALELDCSDDPCFSHFLKWRDHLACPPRAFYPLLSNDLGLHSPSLTEESKEKAFIPLTLQHKKRIYITQADYPPGSMERLCEVIALTCRRGHFISQLTKF